MVRLILAASFLGHLFFFVSAVLEVSPPRPDSLLGPGDVLKLAAVQLLGIAAVTGAALGEGGLGLAVARFLTLPVLIGHAFGFVVFRRRKNAPRGTPTSRRLEDALYAFHVLVAAAGLIGASLF